MTPAVYEFANSFGLTGKTLDVGSFDVNGSVRELFADYTGVDMRAGPNVDVVADAHSLPFEWGTFDNVLCLEMLEHDPSPFETMKEIRRVLKSGGVLMVTVAGIGFPRHDYPCDYWRFTGDGMRVLLNGMDHTQVTEDRDHVYLVAKKP